MLKLQPNEPEWLDILPGVRVQFAPIGIKAVRAARRAVAAALGVDADDVEEAGDALSRELLRRGILAWTGVGDKDGEAIDVTPDAIELFLANADAFEAADRRYVWPWVQRDIEGNASAGSPNGTSAKATPAPDTAASPATPSNPADARPAPTSSTSPRPKKAKPSGR